MSVSNYLSDTASKLIISDIEYNTIDGNITSLKRKINDYFLDSVIEHFAFGSYTRKTLMPRKADSLSDVDYMVVFKDTSLNPTTYLNKLRNFANAKYSTSEIYKSHPTIVLELSKIIIELVPAIKSAFDDYQIPAPSSTYTTWLTTHPNSFNKDVMSKNTNENYQIRPLIRLMKYWNAKNNYVFSSYELENMIVNRFFFSCNSLWDYLHHFVNGMGFTLVGWKDDKIRRLKQICVYARDLDSKALTISAEEEIKKAFPVY